MLDIFEKVRYYRFLFSIFKFKKKNICVRIPIGRAKLFQSRNSQVLIENLPNKSKKSEEAQIDRTPSKRHFVIKTFNIHEP